MDARRFDSLSRLLGHLGTRRGALGLLAGVHGASSLLVAEAGNKKKKRRHRNKKKNKNVCAGKDTCARTAFCQSRAECACFVPEGGGKPFCGSAFPRNVASCDECLEGERCVNLDGPGVPCNIPGLACVTRCPNGK
jgi:hypothetical protein